MVASSTSHIFRKLGHLMCLGKWIEWVAFGQTCPVIRYCRYRRVSLFAVLEVLIWRVETCMGMHGFRLKGRSFRVPGSIGKNLERDITERNESINTKEIRISHSALSESSDSYSSHTSLALPFQYALSHQINHRRHPLRRADVG
jgi:hypothetical protein